MKVSLIAAVSENGVIGREGGLPWHLPDDFRFFKRKTTGHCLIMGRKTLDSIGGVLPNRTSIVVTRDASWQREGVIVTSSLEDALAKAREQGDDEAFIGGGAEIYQLALPVADRIYLTRVHTDVEGDVHFPTFDEDAWKIVDEAPHSDDERHAYAFTIQTWQRVRPDTPRAPD